MAAGHTLTAPAGATAWDQRVRAQFPALGRQMGGRAIVFADNASTTAKPACVIDAVRHYYTNVCANVHRGTSLLVQEADGLFEGARAAVARLIHARPREIVFVRNTTEAINLAAHLVALAPDDEVVCSLGEHHSNLLPWNARAAVRALDVAPDGCLDARRLTALCGPRTRLLAVGHVSNVTGIVAPVAEIVAAARARDVLTLVDAAQSVAHLPIDVKALGCDFLAFSGHKMFGPSGIGVLYAREEILDAGRPLFFGGGMVTHVSPERIELERIPHKFEAGTPNIEGALGLGAAADFLAGLGMEKVHAPGRVLATALVRRLAAVPGVTLRPSRTSAERVPIASFVLNGVAGDDLAEMLSNRYGVMVRSGAHCAEPLVRSFGERALVRASLCLYNTEEEAQYLADAVRAIGGMFGGR